MLDGINNIGSGIFGMLPSFYGPARFSAKGRPASPVRVASPARAASPVRSSRSSSPVSVPSPVGERPVMPPRQSSPEKKGLE